MTADISIPKWIGVIGGSLLLVTGNIQADEAAAVFKKVADTLLDGNRAEALAHLEESFETFSGTPTETRLVEAMDMVKSLGEVDTFVLEYLKQHIGETIPATIRGQRSPVEVVRVDGVDAIHVARRVEGIAVRLRISLVDISPMDKLQLLRSMPEDGRALHTALLAWEARRIEPFTRFASMTGPLAPHLLEVARRRIEGVRQETALRQEAERRERMTTRVVGAENREWEKFEEDKVTRISCDLHAPAPKAVFFEEDLSLETQTTGYHYDLYIPHGYNQNIHLWYPVMFIASPGGNAKMGRMAERLKRDGYVVVMLVESRNANTNWLFNFLAAHDDVIGRVRIAPGAKFGTGMSGGARCASAWPGFRSGFSGIILQAAGIIWGLHDDRTGKKYLSAYTPAVAIAMTMGNSDSNLGELYRLRKNLNPDCHSRVDIFQGGHTWCPSEVFDRVLDWQEEVNFLSPPRSVPVFNAPYAKVEHEPIHPVAYKWFFLLTHRRAENPENPYHQYFHLSRLPVIAQMGGIQDDPEIIDILRQNAQYFQELQKHPEVIANLPVEAAYNNFMAQYNDFVELVTNAYDENQAWGRRFRHTYSRREIEVGRQAVNTGKEIVEKYPETPQAEFLRGFLPGIEIEIN